MTKGFMRRMVLHILKRYGPLHMYGIIKNIKELTLGAYIPSTGVLYPALKSLEEKGLIDIEEIGERKIYKINDKGSLAISLDPPISEYIKNIIRSKYPFKKLFRLAKIIRVNWEFLNDQTRTEIIKILDEAYNKIEKVIKNVRSD